MIKITAPRYTGSSQWENVKHSHTIGACCGSSFINTPKFRMYGITVSDPSVIIPPGKINEGDVIDIVETKNGPIQIHSRTKW